MGQIYISHLCSDEELRTIIKKYKVGVESIEFSIGENLDKKEETIREYQERVPELDKTPLMLHGPFLDLNPVSYDSCIAKASRQRICEAIKMAERLNARGIVFHTSFIPCTNFVYGWAERQIAFWREIIESQTEELSIYLENVYDPDWRPLLEIAEGVKKKNFGICLDAGHVHTYSPIPATEWIEKLGPYIKHMHLHDNCSEKDQHLALGKGTLPLAELFAKIKQCVKADGYTIENNTVEDIEISLNVMLQEGLM